MKNKKIGYCLIILVLVLAFLALILRFAPDVLAAMSYGTGYYTNICGSGTSANFYACPASCSFPNGSCSGNYVVKWTCSGNMAECEENETSWTSYQKVDSPWPGYGKTVQVDVFSKNCRAGGSNTWSCNGVPCGQSGSDCTGYLVWYSGDAPQTPSSPAPTVDIKANGSDGPITVAHNSSANLSWISNNTNSCWASDAWSGSKSVSGSESSANLSSSKTYAITCTGSGGSASDSVTVNVSSQPTLYVSLEPIPNSGYSPLNNVDLKAAVSGTAQGIINYKFDCENNGVWDYTSNTSENPKTAFDICNYSSVGTYTAKVQVERDVAPAAFATAQIVVWQTSIPSAYSSLSIDKLVRNITDNTGWQNSVSADPNDYVGFSIKISSTGNSSANNIWLSDVLPSKISYQGNLRIDGNYFSGDISGGINLGSLGAGQSKTITFDAKVAQESEFTSGVTANLINTARAWADATAQTEDTATVVVSRVPVSSVSLSVNKSVRNLSDNTGFSDSVSADPNELLSFSIEVRATGQGTANNIIVKDTLPDKISYQGNLKIDGVGSSGNIISGLNIGSLYAGQSRTITYEAKIVSEEKFVFGVTNLYNTATAYNEQTANTDTARIIVERKAVAGAATEITTGLTNNKILDYVFLPFVLSAVMLWLFRNYIFLLQEWLEKRKETAKESWAEFVLTQKIHKIKKNENFFKLPR